MVLTFKRKTRRATSLEKRDFEALNAHDRLSLSLRAKSIEYLCKLLPFVHASSKC